MLIYDFFLHFLYLILVHGPSECLSAWNGLHWVDVTLAKSKARVPEASLLIPEASLWLSVGCLLAFWNILSGLRHRRAGGPSVGAAAAVLARSGQLIWSAVWSAPARIPRSSCEFLCSCEWAECLHIFLFVYRHLGVWVPLPLAESPWACSQARLSGTLLVLSSREGGGDVESRKGGRKRLPAGPNLSGYSASLAEPSQGHVPFLWGVMYGPRQDKSWFAGPEIGK